MLSFKNFLIEKLDSGAEQDLILAGQKNKNYLHHADISDAHYHLTDGTHHVKDEEHRKSILKYTKETHGNSTSINNSLIHGEKMSDEDAPHHNNLMNMHKSNPALGRDVHVYSNMGNFDVSKHVKNGGTFNSPAHLSTTLSPTRAREHFNVLTAGNEKNPNIVHFKLPKGYKGGRYIAPHSKFPEEHEMLLKPDQRFKITGKTELEGCTVHHAEPVDHIAEEKIPNVFATIHLKSKKRRSGWTEKQIEDANNSLQTKNS